MDNPCVVCAANGACPYFGRAYGYSARCEEVLAGFIDNDRYEYREAWNIYTSGDSCDDIDISRILSSLL